MSQNDAPRGATLDEIREAWGDATCFVECSTHCPMWNKREMGAGEGEQICDCGSYKLNRLLDSLLYAIDESEQP